VAVARVVEGNVQGLTQLLLVPSLLAPRVLGFSGNAPWPAESSSCSCELYLQELPKTMADLPPAEKLTLSAQIYPHWNLQHHVEVEKANA